MFFRLDNCQKGFFTMYKDLRQFKSLQIKIHILLSCLKCQIKDATLSQGQNIPRKKFKSRFYNYYTYVV